MELGGLGAAQPRLLQTPARRQLWHADLACVLAVSRKFLNERTDFLVRSPTGVVPGLVSHPGLQFCLPPFSVWAPGLAPNSPGRQYELLSCLPYPSIHTNHYSHFLERDSFTQSSLFSTHTQTLSVSNSKPKGPTSFLPTLPWPTKSLPPIKEPLLFQPRPQSRESSLLYPPNLLSSVFQVL